MTTAKQYPISIENNEILIDTLLSLALTAEKAWKQISQKPFAADECVPTSVAVFYKQYLLNNSFTLESLTKFLKTTCSITTIFSQRNPGYEAYLATNAHSVATYITDCLKKLKVPQDQLLSFQNDGIYANNEKIAELDFFFTEADTKILLPILGLSQLETNLSLEKLTGSSLRDAFNAYNVFINLFQPLEDAVLLGLYNDSEQPLIDLKNELNTKIKTELSSIGDNSSEVIINLIKEYSEKLPNSLTQIQLDFLKKIRTDGEVEKIYDTLHVCNSFGLEYLKENINQEFKNLKDITASYEKIVAITNECTQAYKAPGNLLRKLGKKERDEYIRYINTVDSAIMHCDSIVNSKNTPAAIKSDYASLKNDLILEKETVKEKLHTYSPIENEQDDPLKEVISINLRKVEIGKSAQRCAKLYDEKIVTNPRHTSFVDFLKQSNVIFKALVTLGEKILGKSAVRQNKDDATFHRENLQSFGRHAFLGNSMPTSSQQNRVSAQQHSDEFEQAAGPARGNSIH